MLNKMCMVLYWSVLRSFSRFDLHWSEPFSIHWLRATEGVNAFIQVATGQHWSRHSFEIVCARLEAWRTMPSVGVYLPSTTLCSRVLIETAIELFQGRFFAQLTGKVFIEIDWLFGNMWLELFVELTLIIDDDVTFTTMNVETIV